MRVGGWSISEMVVIFVGGAYCGTTSRLLLGDAVGAIPSMILGCAFIALYSVALVLVHDKSKEGAR